MLSEELDKVLTKYALVMNRTAVRPEIIQSIIAVFASQADEALLTDEETFNLGFATAYKAESTELFAYSEGVRDGVKAQHAKTSAIILAKKDKQIHELQGICDRLMQDGTEVVEREQKLIDVVRKAPLPFMLSGGKIEDNLYNSALKKARNAILLSLSGGVQSTQQPKTITEKDCQERVEQARVEERKAIGKWLFEHLSVVHNGGLASYELMCEDVESLHQGKVKEKGE